MHRVEKEIWKGTKSSLLHFRTSMLIEETVTNWLNEKFTEESFRECYVVDVHHSPKKLEIFLDSDGVLDLALCTKINKWLGRKIEESDLIPDAYILEVSSMGLDRPLKLHRQYVKNIGRPVTVHHQNGHIIEGILTEVKPDMIIVQQEVIEIEKKKKVKKKVETIILLDDIIKTFIQIKF